MNETNEIQANHYTHDIPLPHLQALVDIGVLAHVHTTIYDKSVHRFFVPPQDAHPYTVHDYRTDANVNPADLDQQIVSRDREDPTYGHVTS